MPQDMMHGKSMEEWLAWPPASHPLNLSYLFTPETLYQWQRDTLCASALPHSRVIISTPNESGKTSVLAVIFLLSAMCAFPGAMCYATSGSERQVKEQLFENQLSTIVARLPGWTCSTASMKVTAPNGSRLVGYVCKDPDKVEGFHGYWDIDNLGKPYYRPCIYWSDECKGIIDGVHNGIRRIDPDFWMSASTPGLMRGWFYEGIDPDDLYKRLEQRKKALSA